jgi:hypothetical protein
MFVKVMLPVLLTDPPNSTEAPADTGPGGQLSVTVMPGHAWAVDASATRTNRISQDREKECNNHSDDSHHLERCKCNLEFSGVMIFIIVIIAFPFWFWSHLCPDRALVGALRFRQVGCIFMNTSPSIF